MVVSVLEDYRIPTRDEWEVAGCFGCKKRRKISFPPYCQLCWYRHSGEPAIMIRWAVQRHIFDNKVRTCGHRHMSFLSAVECAFALMDKSVRSDPKAIRHWLSRIILAPEE
jgi:hypothetical protein